MNRTGSSSPRPAWMPIAWIAALAVFGAAFMLLALSAPLDHDEHQFVAGGALLAQGLLPYRDFPYHHLPYLTLLYALVFSFSDHLLLAARMTSVAFALGSVALVMHLVHRAFDALAALPRFALAVVFGAALTVNPLFMYASGRAWNHDSSVFFALLAFAFMHRAARAAQPARWLAAAGGAIAIAVGVRSTFAFLGPGFFLGALLLPRGYDARALFGRAAAFSLGAALAFAPLLPFYLISPDGFLHGNLRYNLELNPEYRRLLSHGTAMSLGGKIDYLLYEVVPLKRNVVLLLAYAAASAAVFARPARRFAYEAQLLAVLLPFLLLAAFSATPSWYQYYYPLVPFLLLGIAFACADREAMRLRAIALGFTGLLLAGSVLALRHYAEPFERPSRTWTALCIHALGQRLTAETGPGRILTLGPIFALEGGASIYPELATGPFSYRTAMLVPVAEREKLHVAGPAELEGLLTADLPSGILTGVEASPTENLEGPFVAFALGHGYRPQPAHELLTLWSRKADHGGTVRVAGSTCAYNAY